MVVLDLGVGIGLSLYFWTVMLIQDQKKMLIQEHVLFRKITATLHKMSRTLPKWNGNSPMHCGIAFPINITWNAAFFSGQKDASSFWI